MKALKIASNVLVTIIAVLAFLLYGFNIFGLKPYCVLSGSMESVYPTGSMIYVDKVNPEGLKTGDAITFRMPNGGVATHRIIELVPDETNTKVLFRTKGDENNIADGTLVTFESVIGKPVFCIPLLGFLATYISYPPGKYVALAVSGILILFELITSIIVSSSKNQTRKRLSYEKE